MEKQASSYSEIPLTPENWIRQFGEDGRIVTLIGDTKLGENQLAKMFLKKRDKEFGMIKPTLTDPDIIIEEYSESVEGETERASSYLFVKSFIHDGRKLKFYASVTVSKGGMEVVISNHIINKNALKRKLKEGNIIYLKESLSPNGSDLHLAENQKDLPDLLPTQGDNDLGISSGGKDIEVQEEKQISSQEIIAKAEREVDSSSSEAQKEAVDWQADDKQFREADAVEGKEELNPVGVGPFDNIYNQFKGKVKSPFDFLLKHQSGDLLGGFYQDDIGDIDGVRRS